MRSKAPAVLLVALALAALPAAAQKIAIKDLTPRFRTWLEEEVVYIISPKEKDVFLQLTNDREREMFITAFWKARDEDPNTPENKFKDEHYKRIEYANKWFGRGLKAGGWRSDMGRIWITLGEPKTIDKYENENNVYPMVVWFYSGITGGGLPSTFNVVFFKKDSAGDYILYSPVRDGPQKLMPFYNGDMTNYLQAWGELRQVDPVLAEVSMSLIPGRIRHGHESHAGVRHSDQPEDPQDGLRKRQGRLRREAPQVQGHRRGRVHGELHRERRPRPGHARRRRPGLRSLSSSSRPA